ncbi:head GIN domain-containing protein [Carboxylicivirga sp. M1479]|uniref:head GIN domain-containing protein n=1 Tax=Carboxylicivirga sp. M1479 TaxID=2594476 RepID=UPI001177CD98|nr:head GIN domain-containing protein [Carboxylicivirga sp. M1479]TRX61580.1 DUF2807 domain-containing protein [Carboxylicivirga sp. M1479]
MKRITLVALAVLLTLSSFSQEKEKRNVDDFDKISVSSGIDLYLTQSDGIEVDVTCGKSDIHRLKTEVVGSTLKIYMKGNGVWNWNSKTVPKVYVVFDQLEKLSASGGSDVHGQNEIQQNNLMILSSGGSDVYLELKTDELTLETSGGSDLKLSGTTQLLVASSSGGSDINARNLKAQKVKVSTSGGSDAIVWAEKEIVANASGGSDVTYYGNPQVKQLNESGAGDISHR